MMDAERVGRTHLDPALRVPADAYDRFRDLVERAALRFGGRLGKEATALILLLPDLAILFLGLARDNRVSSRHKILAGAVAVYLISPIDFLPEAVLGPLGMGDDIAMAFLALDTLLNRVPHNVLLDHWRGRRDLIEAARLGTLLGTRVVPRALYMKVSRWLAQAGVR